MFKTATTRLQTISATLLRILMDILLKISLFKLSFKTVWICGNFSRVSKISETQL